MVAGHPVIHHDLSRLGFNFAEGLSDGAIWALIAIGYTLVYGIIELINFAHGDVFMIGSFTAVGLWSDARPEPDHLRPRPGRRAARHRWSSRWLTTGSSTCSSSGSPTGRCATRPSSRR